MSEKAYICDENLMSRQYDCIFEYLNKRMDSQIESYASCASCASCASGY